MNPHKLIPLRVPGGWTVAYNMLFESVFQDLDSDGWDWVYTALWQRKKIEIVLTKQSTPSGILIAASIYSHVKSPFPVELERIESIQIDDAESLRELVDRLFEKAIAFGTE